VNFEWSEAKNQSNIKKHGIDFADALYVFANPLHKKVFDAAHSLTEERWKIIGNVGKILLVIVTYKLQGTVRIVSARAATRTERKEYYGHN
jgi:uncharacterized DUF497 family protein